MRKTFLATVVGVAGLVGAQMADAATAQCANCTDAQMYSMARSLGPSPSPHLVWNPSSGDVKTYRNYCGSLNSTGPVTEGVGKPSADRSAASLATTCNLQTEELSTSTDAVALGQALSQVWHGTSGTMKANLTVSLLNENFPQFLPRKPTAHDFLSDTQFRGEILRLGSTERIYGMSSSPLAAPLAYISTHLDGFMGFSSGIVMTVELVFADGSTIKLLVKFNEAASYVPSSAADASGHTLPEPNYGTPAYPGTWYYPPGTESDMIRFLEYMRQLGVNVQYGSTGAGSGVIKCNWKPENNETICMVPR